MSPTADPRRQPLNLSRRVGTGISLSARDGTYYEKGFFAGGDFFGEGGVGGIVGDVFFAGEESYEGAALLGDVVSDGAFQHGVFLFDGGDYRARGDGRADFEVDLAVGAGEGAEMGWEDYSDHFYCL